MPTRPNLPDWHEAAAAFRGEPQPHLVTRCAEWLATLHRTRAAEPSRAADIDRRRAVITSLTDQWVATHIPPRPDTERYSTSLGAALDEMAGAYVAAEAALMNAAAGSEQTVHEAWAHVGYLATRWADLVSAVVDGQAVLPELASSGTVGPQQNS